MTTEDLAVQDAVASKRPAVVGEGGAPDKPARTTIRVHDFRMPKTLDRNHLRGLQVLYETLAHRASGLLTNRLRTPVTLTLGEFEQHTWGEYAGQLPEPTCLFAATMAPLQGRAVLHVPLPLAMTVVDLRMGGKGKRSLPGRAGSSPKSSSDWWPMWPTPCSPSCPPSPAPVMALQIVDADAGEQRGSCTAGPTNRRWLLARPARLRAASRTPGSPSSCASRSALVQPLVLHVRDSRTRTRR